MSEWRPHILRLMLSFFVNLLNWTWSIKLDVNLSFKLLVPTAKFFSEDINTFHVTNFKISNINSLALFSVEKGSLGISSAVLIFKERVSLHCEAKLSFSRHILSLYFFFINLFIEAIRNLTLLDFRLIL
jgi:hypothetical protein